MRTERPLPDLLRSLCRDSALLHHFVDGERLAEETLALSGLDSGTPKLGIADHHDRETLRLAGCRVFGEHGIFNRGERREQFAHMLDFHAGIEISHIDLEHWHGKGSQPHLEGNETTRLEADRSRSHELEAPPSCKRRASKLRLRTWRASRTWRRKSFVQQLA